MAVPSEVRHALPYATLPEDQPWSARPGAVLRSLCIQAEDWFHGREFDTILELLEASAPQRFQSKVGVSCSALRRATSASADPGLQALTGQALLQVGQVTQKVQYATRAHRGNLLAPRQDLELFRHWHESQGTANES